MKKIRIKEKFIMNTKQRIQKTFNHEQPDKLVFDFGSTLVTGMQVSVIYKLTQVVRTG